MREPIWERFQGLARKVAWRRDGSLLQRELRRGSPLELAPPQRQYLPEPNCTALRLKLSEFLCISIW